MKLINKKLQIFIFYRGQKKVCACVLNVLAEQDWLEGQQDTQMLHVSGLKPG